MHHLVVLLLFVLGFLLFLVFGGKPCRLVARDDSLLYYPRIGATQILLWDEIHFCEVMRVGQGRLYRLYSVKALVEWHDPPSPPFLWLSLRDGFAERQQALLNLIVARTHLVPRTFDRRLALRGEPPVPPSNAE
jgi:hypothetical protein